MSSRPPLQTAILGWRVAGDDTAIEWNSNFGAASIAPGGSQAGHSTDTPPAKLGEVIRERIRQRLGERVHDLNIAVDEATVVLSGRCATFYTKQLAQHAALGVLNDEHLCNQIIVTTT